MSIRLLARFGAAFASLGVLLACGKTENVSPSDVVVQFYVTVEVSGVRDLPEPRALLALEPYLTDSLATALRQARAVRDTASARSSGQAPPFPRGIRSVGSSKDTTRSWCAAPCSGAIRPS